MTKADIVSKISNETGLDRNTVLVVVEALMETIKNSLTCERNVYLRGFGTFEVKRRAQKTARLITRNMALVIPPHNIPSFKPCKEFKDMLK